MDGAGRSGGRGGHLARQLVRETVQHRGTQAQYLATGLERHATTRVHFHRVERRHLANRVGPDLSQRRAHLATRRQRRDRVVQGQIGRQRRGGRPSAGIERVSVHTEARIGRVVIDLIPILEHRQPGAGHVIGGVETLRRVALQRPGQELHEAAAHLGVDRLDQQRRLHLGAQIGRVAAAIAPHRGFPSGHLVDRHRSGIALGGQIETLTPRIGQERIEIHRGARTQIVGGGAGQREVEQHQMGLLAWTHRDDAQVVGLHIAVRDPDLFQIADRLEQVLAPTAQKVGADRPFGPQVSSE